MDNHNLFNCLIFTRNSLPLSSTTPIFIYLPPFISSFLFSPLFFPLSLSYSLPLFLFSLFFLLSSTLPFSFSIFPSFSLPPYVTPLLFFYSSLPLFFLCPFLFATCISLSLNPTLHETSYCSIFLYLSILPSHFLSLPLSLSLSLSSSISFLYPSLF